MTILAIDFEASCLPRHGRSFPIEVGIAGDGVDRSWLIRPHRSWTGWDWTAEAEALHGLSRAYIDHAGLPADVVLAQLVETVAGRPVVADSAIDQYWLETLAGAVGVPAPFTIGRAAALLDEGGLDEGHIAAALAYANAHNPARHRAGDDARWLAALIARIGEFRRAMQPA